MPPPALYVYTIFNSIFTRTDALKPFIIRLSGWKQKQTKIKTKQNKANEHKEIQMKANQLK